MDRLLDSEPETLARGSVEAQIQRLGKIFNLTPPRRSSQGSSLGSMNAASQADPATVPTHLEPSADMDPRDEPAGDV